MAVAATVQVVDRARGTSGSGVVIGVAGPFIYVLTANHLVSTEHSMEIRALDNQSPGGEVRIVSPPEVLAGEADVDLALLRVPASDWRPAAVRVCPPELVPREMGFSVVVTGWAGEATPGFRVAQVESRRQVRKSPESDAVWAWQTNEPHDRGDSGGAMVTAQGYLIGIASGVNEGKGYFAEAESMHRLLRQNGLKWLYEEPLTEFLQKNR
jgi:S1-C subfamily serine protease